LPVDVVAYRREVGAYSEEGALALFPDAEHRPLPSIRTVFEAVEVGRAGWGLVPMDNSQAGSINETYDLFLRHGLHLVGETMVRVDHSLLALRGSTIDDLREVVSHPQAIAQCEEFLSTLDVTVRAEYNTAGAAKRIAEDRLGEPDKSSLVFGVGHLAGSLYRCLGMFAERHLNLAKLESRPRQGRPWEYVFYADVEAPAHLPAMVDALAALSEHATFTRLLGTYAGALPRKP